MPYHPTDPPASEMLADVRTAVKVGAEAGGTDLDAWEEDFIDSMWHQLGWGNDLTVKQLEKLRAIWDRI